MVSRLKDPETPEGLALTEEIRDTVNHAIGELPEDCAPRSCCASSRA